MRMLPLKVPFHNPFLELQYNFFMTRWKVLWRTNPPKLLDTQYKLPNSAESARKAWRKIMSLLNTTRSFSRIFFSGANIRSDVLRAGTWRRRRGPGKLGIRRPAPHRPDRLRRLPRVETGWLPVRDQFCRTHGSRAGGNVAVDRRRLIAVKQIHLIPRRCLAIT